MFFPKRINGASAKKLNAVLHLDFNKTRGAFLKQKNVQLGQYLGSTCTFKNAVPVIKMSRAVFSKDGHLITYVVGGGLHRSSGPDWMCIVTSTDNDCVVSHTEYHQATVFSCKEGTYYTHDGVEVYPMTNRYFTSLAVCDNRVFGVDGRYLSMTAADSINEWDESRRITAHTDLDALVALDKLYALGDTCYSLAPDAVEMNVKFHPICYGIGAVQTESVATFGKRAVFASEYGLYELKNGVVAPIFTQLNDYVSFDGCVACAYKGKYYVTCKRKDGDMTGNDILLVLDVDNEKISAVMDVKMQHISVVDDKLYAVSNNYLYVATDDNVDSSYVETLDFHSSDVKYLNKLTLKTLSDVDVWIDNGEEKRRYRVKGKNTLQRVPLAGCGRQFCVEVQARDGLKLDYLELSARSYEV